MIIIKIVTLFGMKEITLPTSVYIWIIKHVSFRKIIKELVSIKNNDLLKFIKQSLQEDLTFKDLIKLISEKFLINDEQEIKVLYKIY